MNVTSMICSNPENVTSKWKNKGMPTPIFKRYIQLNDLKKALKKGELEDDVSFLTIGNEPDTWSNLKGTLEFRDAELIANEEVDIDHERKVGISTILTHASQFTTHRLLDRIEDPHRYNISEYEDDSINVTTDFKGFYYSSACAFNSCEVCDDEDCLHECHGEVDFYPPKKPKKQILVKVDDDSEREENSFERKTIKYPNFDNPKVAGDKSYECPCGVKAYFDNDKKRMEKFIKEHEAKCMIAQAIHDNEEELSPCCKVPIRDGHCLLCYGSEDGWNN